MGTAGTGGSGQIIFAWTQSDFLLINLGLVRHIGKADKRICQVNYLKHRTVLQLVQSVGNFVQHEDQLYSFSDNLL